MNTVCVVSYKLTENGVSYKGILVETTNPYTNKTNQVIIDADCKPVETVYNFVRTEEEGCFKFNSRY